MIPIYQTIIGRADDGLAPGNCMQAVIASLLEIQLEDVPHFLLYGDKWFEVQYNFLMSKGIEMNYALRNPYRLGSCGNNKMDCLPECHGIKGCFYAGVYSPGYFTPEEFCQPGYVVPTHAVLCDNHFNIVHDPNPKYMGRKEYPLSSYLGYNGILSIEVLQDIHGMYL